MQPGPTQTRITLAVSISLLLAGSAAQAASRVNVEPNRVVVQVKGIVCSFCAHGAEKSLKALGCLNKEFFGSDGVKVDIDNQQITLAIKPRQAAERLELSLTIGGAPALEVLRELVHETFDLVESHMPELDVARARKRFTTNPAIAEDA